MHRCINADDDDTNDVNADYHNWLSQQTIPNGDGPGHNVTCFDADLLLDMLSLFNINSKT